jgi:hypothetical protein
MLVYDLPVLEALVGYRRILAHHLDQAVETRAQRMVAVLGAVGATSLPAGVGKPISVHFQAS